MKQPIDPTGVARRKVQRLGERAGAADELDAVVAEEPLEIRVDGETIGVTMRTPGDDARLALGFLFGEGIVGTLLDVGTVSHCGRPGQEGWGNVIEVRSGPGTSLDADRILEGRRFIPTTSACGVCGRQTIDDLIARCGTVGGGAVLPLELVLRSVDRMREVQVRFEATGGLHAAAAFDEAGELISCHEDVGRHNAVDKVVGDLLRLSLVGKARRGSPPALLVVSGRAGFEIVQKAAMAKIPIVASVSASTSLAIDLAESSGLTLAGFARGGSLNVYTHPWRIAGGEGRGRLRSVPKAPEDGGGMGREGAGQGQQDALGLGFGVPHPTSASIDLRERRAVAQAYPDLPVEPWLAHACAVAERVPEQANARTLAAGAQPQAREAFAGKERRGAPALAAPEMRGMQAFSAPDTRATQAPAVPRTRAMQDFAALETSAMQPLTAPGTSATQAPASPGTGTMQAFASPGPGTAPALAAAAPSEPAVALPGATKEGGRGVPRTVPANEVSEKEQPGGSLAAELLARTDRMIHGRRSGARQPATTTPLLSFEKAEVAPATSEVPPKVPPAAPAAPASSDRQQSAPAPSADPVLIDDRDPANPAPVFAWSDFGWSTGRVR